jgi:hypothetical protein
MKSNRDGKHQRQPQRQRNGEMAAARLFSFRMIGDTRIECQDANSAWEDTESKTVGSHRTGAEPRSPASAEVDEPLSTAGSQRELYLPALWNQSAEFLSLVETV